MSPEYGQATLQIEKASVSMGKAPLKTVAKTELAWKVIAMSSKRAMILNAPPKKLIPKRNS